MPVMDAASPQALNGEPEQPITNDVSPITAGLSDDRPSALVKPHTAALELPAQQLSDHAAETLQDKGSLVKLANGGADKRDEDLAEKQQARSVSVTPPGSAARVDAGCSLPNISKSPSPEIISPSGASDQAMLKPSASPEAAAAQADFEPAAAAAAASTTPAAAATASLNGSPSTKAAAAAVALVQAAVEGSEAVMVDAEQNAASAERSSSIQDHAIELGPSEVGSQDPEPAGVPHAEALLDPTIAAVAAASDMMEVELVETTAAEEQEAGKAEGLTAAADGEHATASATAAAGDRAAESTPAAAKEAAPAGVTTEQASISPSSAEGAEQDEDVEAPGVAEDEPSLPMFEFPLLEKLLKMQRDLEVSTLCFRGMDYGFC